MGLLSKFENKMEDGIEGAAGALGRSSLTPVQITKKAEKQMRREKIVGAGKQYAPTLYTVLVNPPDDAKLFKYYPTLAGETETYLMAKARELGYVMDGQPLVRFLADPQLKNGKFEVVAEMVASAIVEQLRDDEMARYGLPTSSGRKRGGHAGVVASREHNPQPRMQPLPNLQSAQGQNDQYGMPQMGDQAERQYAGASMGRQGGHGHDPRLAARARTQMAQAGRDAYNDIHRHAISADEMNVPSVLGSQAFEVPQASKAARGVMTEMEGSAASSRRSKRGEVDPEQLRDDVQRAQQLQDDGVLDVVSGGDLPVVVMPALSVDVENAANETPSGMGIDAVVGAVGGAVSGAKAAGVRGSGVDAVFGEQASASTVDIASGQSPAGAEEPKVYLYDEERDRAYVLTGGVQRIGRESSNDIVVPDINISRVHAEICMQPNGQWVISDLGSTNGLFVNGRKIQSAPLRDADMITLGTSTLEFQLLA